MVALVFTLLTETALLSGQVHLTAIDGPVLLLLFCGIYSETEDGRFYFPVCPNATFLFFLHIYCIFY